MRIELKSLTGLRGLAAIIIVFMHYLSLQRTSALSAAVLTHLYLTVDIFQVLSGFVIAMAYEGRLDQPPQVGQVATFFRHRIARIYPLYAVTTLVCFILCRLGWLSFLSPDSSLPALGANLLMVQSWGWPGSSLNGPGWSISTEWAANLLFPVLLPLLLSRSAVRAGIVAGIALLVLAVTALIAGQIQTRALAGALDIVSGPGALLRCLTEFVLGMLCWRLRSRVAWVACLATTWAQLGLLGALVVAFTNPGLDVLCVVLLAALILAFSFERSFFSRLLAAPPLRALGVISYSIYLVHIPLLPLRDAILRGLDAAAIPHAWTLAALGTIPIMLAVATLTYRTIEKPGQRWLNAVLGDGRARTVRAGVLR